MRLVCDEEEKGTPPEEKRWLRLQKLSLLWQGKLAAFEVMEWLESDDDEVFGILLLVEVHKMNVNKAEREIVGLFNGRPDSS